MGFLRTTNDDIADAKRMMDSDTALLKRHGHYSGWFAAFQELVAPITLLFYVSDARRRRESIEDFAAFNKHLDAEYRERSRRTKADEGRRKAKLAATITSSPPEP